MYTPISQRKTVSKTTGYTPIAERSTRNEIDESPLPPPITAPEVKPKSSSGGMEFRVGEGMSPEQTKVAYHKIATPDVMQIPFEGTRLGIAKNTVTGVPAASLKVGKGILNFGEEVLQGIARSVGSAALTVAGRFGTNDGSNVADSLKPEDFHNNFTQALFENVFGKDSELKPIETRIAEAEPKVKAFGEELDRLANTPGLNAREKIVVNALSNLAKNHPKSLSFAGVMGTVGMDLTGFGGLEENAVKQIVNTRNLGEALTLAQKLGIAPDLLDNFAEQVVKTNTTKEASTLLKTTAETMQTTKFATKEVAEKGITDVPYTVPGDKPQMYLPVAERPAQPSLLDVKDVKPNTLSGIDTANTTRLTPAQAKPLANQATKTYYDDVLTPAKNEGKAQIIGADDLKDYFGSDYNVNNHPAYSQAADNLYKKAVEESPASTVKFTVGGTGSGKSDFLVPDMAEGYNGVIYDSTGWNYEGIKKQIDYARHLGKDAEVYAIIPDIARSRAYTFLREASGKHPVTEAAFIRTHANAIETLKQLINAGEDVYVLDTRTLRDSVDVGNAQYLHNPIELLNDLRYNEDHVKKSIEGITKENAEAFIREGKKGTGSVPKENGSNKVNAVEKAAERAKAGEDFGPRTNFKEKKAPAVKKERGVSAPKNVELPKKLYEQQSQIQGYNEMIAEAKDRLGEHPGKKLQQYISRKEGIFEDFKNPDLAKTPSEKQAIIERNKKIMKEAEKQFEGTKFSEEFDNPDSIRQSIDEYRELKESIEGMSHQRLEAKRAFYEARKEFYTQELDRRSMNSLVARQERVKVLEEVAKMLRKEGRDRKEKIEAIADFFNLTDQEMKKLNSGNKDYRLMSDKDFESHLKAIQGKAYEVAAHREAVMEIENTIHDLELIKVENLREAMKLKKFENMSKNELDSFNDLLQTFKKGDEFLGKRQLQTVKFTDMAGIKTRREALEFLAKEAKVPIEELKNIKVSEFDKFLYDNPLARKNPFYKVMVDNTNYAEVEASGRFFEVKKETEKLISEARASRKRSLLDKMIPSDNMIFDYLEGDAETKLEYAKRMTPQEYKAATYIRDKYAEVRDYLVEQETLKKFRANYVTHIRRDFLEAWKDGARGASLTKGFKEAVKEMFDVYKQDSAIFNILDTKTGEVLPLEKFFKFSMTRKGNLVPTQNVSKAFLEYMRVFEQKRQLDSFIPKLDIFAHVLSPKAMTPRGLEFDDSLKRFVKTWINSKKGRTMDVGVIKQGEKIDWALRSGVALTRLLDLGLNIPVGLASNIGEQAFNFIDLGAKKFATGAARYATKQGRQIVNNYENIVGEKFFAKMADTSKSMGEKFHEGIFGLFSSANRRGNAVHLLATMTPEEFKAGKMSAERLAQLRSDIGKYHVVPGMESIVGKTSLGGVGKQYRSWAVPALHSTIDNLKKVGQLTKAKDFKGIWKSKEGAELFRGALLTSSLLLAGYGYYDSLSKKKDRDFLENLAYKSMNDGLSFIGALNPSFWSTPARLQSFVADLGLSLSNIAVSLATGDRTKEGDIQGLKKLKATVTPAIVKQVSKIGDSPPEPSTKKTLKTPAGLPELPSLKKTLPAPPGLPKLPSLK